MTVETLLSESLKLKPEDQFRVIEAIMDNLSVPNNEIDALWNKEAKRRLALYDAGLVSTISAEELLNQSL